MVNILKAIFGTKNEREIKRLQKRVEAINALEDSISALSDDELQSKTIEFKERLKKGETLDQVLEESFAVVREAAKRVLGMRHYDVQLLGGMVLHEGKIAEMKTGEGKTLVATCPVYLNALEGKGVHLITVNDYLATRDCELMGRVYNFLGLSAGVIVGGQHPKQRKEAYQCDITYGTNSEFGFDYLRDNMVASLEERVQKPHHFCIVDEVDSILIDEARTPLIISGIADNTTKWYETFNTISKKLKRSFKTEGIKDVKAKKEMQIPDSDWEDYEVDEKANNITLTEKGIKNVEKLLKIDNLYSPDNVELTHYLLQALKAKELFQRDKDYLVRDDEVIIIDEFTGRAMEGRRYSGGLHQAIEAKEGVSIAGENQTLATITLQNYFKLYEKLSGMTGTAETEAEEFIHTYNLEVVVMPTHRPIQRADLKDRLYASKEEKYEAIVEKIRELHEKGQPVLVGTISISNSELLSRYLKKDKVPHSVLNAKFHAQEAEIISQAGRLGAVTIATNMAGRGTDIMLGGNPEALAHKEVNDTGSEAYKEALDKYKNQCEQEKAEVLKAGGLFILGTERHESRRIDNQLRGRAGRQGDPGASEFYISFEDELPRLFGGERIKGYMEKLNFERGEVLTGKLLTNQIEKAQKKVESRNFGIRKNLLEFDNVMNKQRTAIYDSRNAALEKEDLKDVVMNMLRDTIVGLTTETLVGEFKEDWDIGGLSEKLSALYGCEIADKEEYKQMEALEYGELLFERIAKGYDKIEANIGSKLMRGIEKHIIFEVVDARWRENLKSLEALREGIYLRSYGQKDPLVEYKLLSGELYGKMLSTVKEEVTSFLFKVRVRTKQDANEVGHHDKHVDKVKYTAPTI